MVYYYIYCNDKRRPVSFSLLSIAIVIIATQQTLYTTLERNIAIVLDKPIPSYRVCITYLHLPLGNYLVNLPIEHQPSPCSPSLPDSTEQTR